MAAGVLYVALFATSATAAQASLDPTLDPHRYARLVFAAREGLADLNVQALEQTADGYLWIGTQTGLVRFDGVRFVTFTTRGTAALGADWIGALFQDSRGRLWIGSSRGTLAWHHDGEFVAVEGRLDGGHVVAIGESVDGRLWAWTEAEVRSATLEDPGTWRAERRDAPIWMLSTPASADGDARWREIAPGTLPTSADLRRLPPLVVLVEDGVGRRWFRHSLPSTRGPFSNFRLQASPFPEELAAGPFDDLAEVLVDASGTAWVGHHNRGLERWSGRSVTRLDDAGFAGARVRAMLMDHDGGLWIGTYAEGLVRLANPVVETLSSREGLPSDNVRAVLEDREGDLWVATWGGGLVRARDLAGGTRALRVFGRGDGLPHENVWAIHETPAGELWVGTADGIARRAGERFVATGRSDGLPMPGVRAITSGHDGELWLGGQNGLVRMHGGTFTHYTEMFGRPLGVVMDVLFDREERLWVATDANGVLLRESRGDAARWRWLGLADGLASESMRDIVEDDDGTIWLGSSDGGLTRWRDGRGRSIGMRHGLPDDQVMRILDDGGGAFWLSSNRGIARVYRADLESFFAGLAERVHGRSFGVADGLQTIEANGSSQPAGWRGRDGRLWFPTMGGVVSIAPAEVPDTPPPAVLIEEVVADGAPLSRRGEARVPAGTHSLEIGFTAPVLRRPGVTFRYQLRGVDPRWIEAGARRRAYYTRVPPGRYELAVQAASADGEWPTEATRLGVVVAPFYYQTTGFCLVLVGLLAATLAAGYWLRVRSLRQHQLQLETEVAVRTREVATQAREIAAQRDRIERQALELAELDRAKTRFFHNLSHELRTPLTLVLSPLSTWLEKRSGEPDAAAVALAHDNARSVMELVDQILEIASLRSAATNLAARDGEVVGLVEGVRESMAALAERADVRLDLDADPPGLPACFDGPRLQTAIRNLVANAIKFTPAGGTVTIAVRLRASETGEELVEISVRDTGIGIPPEDLPLVFERYFRSADVNRGGRVGTGIGLSLVKEIVELHGGEVAAASREGEGSVFSLRIPRWRPRREAEAEDRPPDPAPDAEAVAELAVPDDETPARGAAIEHVVPSARIMRAHVEEQDQVPTILVVENNEELRRYVRRGLEPDYRVVDAADGREGLERARTLFPDLVVSDILMPRLDGLRMLEALRRDPDTTCTPVILLSSRAEVEHRIEGLAAGADDYLPKPFDLRELAARIARHLEARRALRQALLVASSPVLERRVPSAADGGSLAPGLSQRIAGGAASDASAPPLLHSGMPAAASRPGHESEGHEFATRFRAAVEASLSDPELAVESLARRLHVSRAQLFRKLAASMETSPAQYIREARLARARELLTDASHSISDVAYGVGFNSRSYFIRCFREAYGETPGRYRSQLGVEDLPS